MLNIMQKHLCRHLNRVGRRWLWRLLLLALAVPMQAQANKILLYRSPYGSTNVCVLSNYALCEDTTAGLMSWNSSGWLELDMTSAMNSASQYTSYTVYKHGAYSSEGVGSASLYSLFQQSDTVWLVPNPYPSGTGVKAYTYNPLGSGHVKTVMLWNPWPGQTPRIEVGSTWDSMTVLGRNSGFHGWASETVVGYSTDSACKFIFADSAKKEFLNSQGISALSTNAAPLSITIDSIAAVSDTIWIRAYPEVAATGVRETSARQIPKAVFAFNPWDGNLPIQHPLITFGDDDTARVMDPSASYCGWYSYSYFERTPKIYLTNQKTKTSFGARGYGDRTRIDLSAYGDTGWIAISDSLPKPSSTVTSDRGDCELVFLAATVRDFASSRSVSSAYYNREFGRGHGCARGGWSVVKGMVDSVLGSDRKPVRSAGDTGYAPNSWTFAGRCIYDTLEPADRAEVGDTGIASSWFKTVAGKNTETCRDIPLTVDSTTGNYLYDAKYYFPIDDLKMLSDGTVNPYYDQISGEDGKLHNFGFCLESHGNFEYRKGQVFRFAGDDDVWFFINGRLAVDIGGIHGTSKDSVFLDAIGRVIDTSWVSGKQVYDTSWTDARLTEGKTYSFDFFFCERNPSGSDMMISTTMNLRTDAGFLVRDTATSSGSHTYTMHVSTTSGQGCQAVTSVAAATGIVRILGGGFTSPHQLSSGTWYGGITVDSAAGTVVIDSAAITGLRAGTYTVQFVYPSDTTVVRSYTFKVAHSLTPQFVAGKKYIGAVGSSFAVQVGTYNEDGPDSTSIRFFLSAPTGISLFRDSLLTEAVTAADTLMTGENTVPRTFWVRGDAAGVYTIAVGSGAGDTADRCDSIIFLKNGLRFIDSAGNVISAAALEKNLGDTVRLNFETFSGDSTCVTCGSTVSMSSSVKGIIFLDSLGREETTVTLRNGRGAVRVTSTTTLDHAALTFTVNEDSSETAVWEPVSFSVRPPDFAAVFDRDGDGRPDSLTVHLQKEWTAGNTVRFSWPDAASGISVASGDLRVSADALTLSVTFADSLFPTVATASTSGGFNGFYAYASETPQAFAVADSIAPVPLWATLSYGPVTDTLRIALSERGTVSGADLLERLSAFGWEASSLKTTGMSLAGDTLLLYYADSLPDLAPAVGDSVRLGAALTDTSGNVPTAVARRAVIVKGGQRPPQSGWYLDEDGDGAIDHAVVRFRAAVRGDSLPSFIFSLPVNGALQRRSGTTLRTAADSSLLAVALDTPFAAGVTAFDGAGLGWMDGQWSFDMEDSVAPSITSAVLHLAEDYVSSDTLIVSPSEALRLDFQMPWLQVKTKDSVFTYLGVDRDTVDGQIRIFIPSTVAMGIAAGDSVRYVSDGSVKDRYGNVPPAFAVWHRVAGGKHRTVTRLIDPVPLIQFTDGAILPTQSSAIRILATEGDSSSWAAWSPEGGYDAGGDVCDRDVCNGPELVLNAPVKIMFHIYDHLGTHVAGTGLTVDSAALESLVRDRLGRTRVRLSWDYRTDGGERVADGVYLLRLILIYEDAETGARRVVNRIWKIGFSRAGKD